MKREQVLTAVASPISPPRAMVAPKFGKPRYYTIRFDDQDEAYIIVGFRSKCREYLTDEMDFWYSTPVFKSAPRALSR